MNERFVCVKLDREERPDLDAIYMEACQAMTGHGGWPLNVFLTPEQVPFYAGTYFPPAERGGMPSWRRVLAAVADAWDTKRDEIRARRRPDRASGCRAARCWRHRTSRSTRRRARRARSSGLREAFDPDPRRLRRRAEVPARVGDRVPAAPRRDRDDVEHDAARDGGAAGCTTRSAAASRATRSTTRWLVPHFEKMLYDNALLARAYLHGWQVTGERAVPARARARRSTGRCARCAAPRAASAPRSTPTPRASRASSTSGASTSCATVLGDDADAAIA